MGELPETLRETIDAGGRDRTVLVLRLAAMGDILRTVPPVRLVREALPHARIVWGLDAGWRVVLDGHPDVDELLPLPRKDWDRLRRSPLRWPALIRSVLAYRRSVRAAGADLVLDFHGNLRTGWIGWWSRAPVRVGYSGHQQKEGNHWFTNLHVPSGDRRTPRMERNLDLVRALGIDTSRLPGGNLSLPDGGREEAARILSALPPRPAILSPGASKAQIYKRPPAALLAAAVQRLASLGVETLVVWGPGEEEDARAVVARAGAGAHLAPPTDLPTLAALTEAGRIFLSGDTGPLHLACAVGTPVVGVYGPTDPVVNQPWGVPFRTVYPPGIAYTGIKRLDRAAGGFAGLTPEAVADAAADLLAATGSEG